FNYTQLLFVLFSGINKVYQIRSLRAFFIGWNFANTPTNILEPKNKKPAFRFQKAGLTYVT
ncbi:hypothetical protein, partial [Virgibacillus sp. JSM 102003]|uniref:hypothetical protein n=1 Tax=Virgibacillus sp. JSM 102003 TaxID=1562108 RepID=UPI0035BF0429